MLHLYGFHFLYYYKPVMEMSEMLSLCDFTINQRHLNKNAEIYAIMHNLNLYLFFMAYMCMVYCKVNANYIDLKNCKLTHAGVNFLGDLSETRTGSQCRRWETIMDFTDDDFPDLSAKKARNFCRNPSADPNGPWCYIHSAKEKKESCNIPLCLSDCRLTGPGMEYSGTVSFSAFKRCELWSKYWNKLTSKRSDGSTLNVKNNFNVNLYNTSATNLYNYCRNPDGDLGGEQIIFTFLYFVGCIQGIVNMRL